MLPKYRGGAHWFGKLLIMKVRWLHNFKINSGIIVEKLFFKKVLKLLEIYIFMIS